MNLLTEQGCLSAEAIKKIAGTGLSVSQEEVVKKHLLSCSLCRDAVEGAGYFEGTHKYDEGLSDLHAKWDTKSAEISRTTGKTNAGLISIAASIVILIGLSIFYFGNRIKSRSILTQIATQGISLDSALSGVNVLPLSETSDYIAMNETDVISRNSYISDTTISESAIPLGKIENTRVFAKSLSDKPQETIIEDIQTTRSTKLSYPSVAMHKPPRHIDMLMPDEEVADEEMFVVVEEMPLFRGSDLNAFRTWVQKAIVYPGDAVEGEVSGRVYAQFIINNNGKLTEAKILKGVHPTLDDEVLRVLKDSPIWQPGTQRGRPVSVLMILPVDFYLY